MPLYIMCFNLKDGGSEEEFAKKAKEWVIYIKDKVEGLCVYETISPPRLRC